MKKSFIKIFFLLLFLSSVGLFYNVAGSPAGSEAVEVYFFDVGQGDAALIQRGYYQILIDGGPDDKILTLLGQKMPLGDRIIEKVVLTHPHADHITGLNQVMKRYEVKSVVGSGVADDSSQYQEFLNGLKEQNLSIEIPAVGSQTSPFLNGRIEYFWPGDRFLQKNAANLNDTSVVFNFCYFSTCALFTGDIENDAQEEMVAANKGSEENFSSKIVKAPHHGSKNGNGLNLLYLSAKPQYAVISAGADNQFGHPHVQTLSMLESLNIEILRTDQTGTIEFHLIEGSVERK